MEYNIAFVSKIDKEAIGHLNRKDKQEDICFCLYEESIGVERKTFLVNKIILPKEGDREVHGNVSIYEQFFTRAKEEAKKTKSGIIIMHSHPEGEGHQSMSPDDYSLEQEYSVVTSGSTKKPLIGMTLSGEDEFWSGRVWCREENKFKPVEISKVRVVRDGTLLMHAHPDVNMKLDQNTEIIDRTLKTWGKHNQEKLINLNIGVMGVGSVGCVVAEYLGRMGVQNLLLVDFDKLEEKNLDRHVSSTLSDVGRYKTDILYERLKKISTNPNIKIKKITKEIKNERSVPELLDCDIIFACVDSHGGRHVANKFACHHLIPIIDGGVGIHIKDPNNEDLNNEDYDNKEIVVCSRFISDSSACLRCEGQYDIERINENHDPEYPSNNVVVSALPYSSMAGVLSINHFISIIFGRFQLKEFSRVCIHFHKSNLSSDDTIKLSDDKICSPYCCFSANKGIGFTDLYSRKVKEKTWLNMIISFISKVVKKFR